VISGALKRPFAEQVAFFRGKLGNLVPTAAWDDITKSSHDKAFMVAGAAKADLLTDLAAAVDRSITEGKSLEAFRQDFMATIERRGWSGFTGDESAAKRAWRTRVIYSTNASTSYAAGRYAQLQEFPVWVYQHSDSVAYPRPQHVSWNGLSLPADHDFWTTHYPPNGWGCHCYVVGSRSGNGAKRLGGDPDKALPDGWNAVDVKTGAPAGIDKGWGYAPGASVAHEVRQAAEKVRHWDYQLAKAYMQEMPNRDALAISYRSLPFVADDVRRYAQRVLDGRTSLDIPPVQTMGLLTSAHAAKVGKLAGVWVDGFDFALDPYSVRHIRDEHGDEAVESRRGQRAVVAADYARLPALLSNPDEVVDGGRSNVGHRIVRYVKRIGDELYTAAFEIRTGRKMLALQSMWIR
jgi:hypothetical protein